MTDTPIDEEIMKEWMAMMQGTNNDWRTRSGVNSDIMVKPLEDDNMDVVVRTYNQCNRTPDHVRQKKLANIAMTNKQARGGNTRDRLREKLAQKGK